MVVYTICMFSVIGYQEDCNTHHVLGIKVARISGGSKISTHLKKIGRETFVGLL